MRLSSTTDVRLFRSVDALPADLRGSAVAIGNFDGVHKGHQTVIRQARAAADRLGVALGAMIFEPHPVRLFNPDAPPFRLTQIEKRAALLNHYGTDFTLALPFDRDMAQRSATAFMDDILVRGLAVRHVVVGDDFHFGAGRSGSPSSLVAYGAEAGFSTDIIDAEIEPASGIAFSSSDIRAALARGDIERATQWLGHPWSIEGEVRQGDQRGRTIQFPTANIELGDYMRPAFGVYAVSVEIKSGAAQGQTALGVANIGLRPTVGTEAPRLEAHLFDFDQDIYGCHLEVALHHFIRGEQKFENFDALRAQISRDAEAARLLLRDFKSE